MEISKIAEQIKTKEDFIKFLDILLEELLTNKKEWENIDLDKYLEAMQAFLKDSTEQSLNRIDFSPSWSLFAKILLAASIYE